MSQKAKDQDDRMMKAVVLLSLGSFVFFFFVSVSGFNSLLDLTQDNGQSDQQVLGVSNLPAPSDEKIEVMLNNSNIGEGVLELEIPQPSAISGAEFHFTLTESLDIRGVICSSEFVCVEKYEDDTFRLSLFRLPDQADVPMYGKVKVATILYARDTFGEMIVNGDETEESMVVELGSDENLLNSETVYLAIGRNPF